MPDLILGTAGHIDHGKTALVRALTGVDTDRLKEEKERGITIDLGFAEMETGDGLHVGVVDVPGHEDFIRNMVAGATGMDLVLLVVAADEGVMPQTREHLAILEFLDVSRMVVALTKCDLVEPDWLELVRADVDEALHGTPFAGSPQVPTSARTGQGLDELRRALGSAAGRTAGRRRTDDLFRLPVDRGFTIHGTGTVVTGTLWSGSVRTGEVVRILPGDASARVRGLQVHGRDVERAGAGRRTAVALAGGDVSRARVRRGVTLVREPGWVATWMLTVRVRVLPDTGWSLHHNQRLRVHLGTAEILARCADLGDGNLGPGAEGWIQLRLEEPVVARARDRLVLRSYSPVTTIGGGVVAEAASAKRRSLGADDRIRLEHILDGSASEALHALLELDGWTGTPVESLAVRTGLTPGEMGDAMEHLPGIVTTGDTAFSRDTVADAEGRVLDAVARVHEARPLLALVPLDPVRASLPPWAHPGLADAVVTRLVEAGALEARPGGVRDPGHAAGLTGDQESAIARLRDTFDGAGLAPPPVEGLPEALRVRSDLWDLLRHLEARGVLATLPDGTFISRDALEGAEREVQARLAGRTGLGPSDFKEVLPVTRKHLIPLLAHLDRIGITLREGKTRSVRSP